MFIANPAPASQEAGRDEIETHIREALVAASNQNFNIKEVAPFLIKYNTEHTKGESPETNIAFILNNANVGAGIAVACAEINR